MGLAFMILTFASLALIGIVFLPEGQARTGDVGIALSQTCVTMHRANLTTDCPTYEEIMVIFPDQSRPLYSGKFVAGENGFVEREKPQIKQHYAVYQFDKGNRIWIDPPADVRNRMDLIVIEPSMETYVTRTQPDLLGKENHTRYMGQHRYISERCEYSAVSAQHWELLLGDTIWYLLRNCQGYTNILDIITIYDEPVVHDITTTYKWFLDNWYKKVKEECRGLCFEY